MQSDLLLGDQMYHLTLSKVEIPHSENADVEYYTTYLKTPEKGREPPPSSCACARPSTPSGDLRSQVVMVLIVVVQKQNVPVAHVNTITSVTSG
jgi:hypothetical protein